jgi:small-conductance mechanosensitive channel
LERLNYLEGEHKKLISDRDKAKEEKRLEEDKRLTEQGEFKTLAETRQSELDKLQKAMEGLNETISTYNQRDEKELEALLPNVPEGLRDEVSNKDLPIASRLSLARKLSNSKTPLPDYKAPGEKQDNSLTRQAFDALAPAEQSKYMREGGKIHD